MMLCAFEIGALKYWPYFKYSKATKYALSIKESVILPEILVAKSFNNNFVVLDGTHRLKEK